MRMMLPRCSVRFLTITQALLVLALALVVVKGQSGNQITYVYDELGRLVAVIDPVSETAVYSYDAVGNILNISRYSSSVVSIVEFTPNSGSIGATVTISGTGFSATASQNVVSFNGVAASVTSSSFSQIVATVPSGATTGPISVTSPSGSAVSSANFVVGDSTAPTITSFTPTIGTAGTAVTVTGTNFDPTSSNNRVKLNATLASVTSNTATNLQTNVPPATGSGRISVATVGGTATSTADFFIPPAPHAPSAVEVTGRMAIGENRTVALSNANNIGLIVFDGVEGQRISLKTNSWTLAIGSRITIYKPNGTMLDQGTIYTGGAFIDSSYLTATGTYTVLVNPVSTGNVNFTIYNVVDIASSITLGGPTVTLSLPTPGQNARVSFSGTTGQRVHVGMSGVTIGTSTSFGTNASVLNPNGSTLFSPMDVGTSGAGTAAITLPTTGVYVIFINPNGGNTGTITLTLSEELTGTLTIGGSSLPLSFSRVGQNAAITFDGTIGQRVSLGMSNVTIGTSTSFGTYITINKPDGSSLLATFDLGTSGAGTATLTLPVTGTYKIFVDPRNDKIGNVTLTLSEELTGTVSINGSALPLSLSRVGQNAAVTFDGTVGQRISLGISGVTIGTSTWNSTNVWISKPDGTTFLATFVVGTSGGGTAILTLPVSGTYKIFIDPQSDNTGNITLTLSEELTGVMTIGGTSLSLSLGRPGQNAVVSFEGNAGQRISLGLSGVTIGTSTWDSAYASIIKPDGSSLLSNFQFGTSGAGTAILTLPVTGTYKIYIDPQSASTGNVTLTLSEELTGTVSINGSALPLSLSRVGQNAAVTFDGTVGQRISLGMSGVTIGTSTWNSTNVWISKPDGTTFLATFVVGTSGGGTAILTLPVSGTYKIFIDPQSDNTGNITLTLSEELTGVMTIGGTSLSLSLGRPGQNAVVSFEGNAGQRISLGLSGVTIGTSTWDSAYASIIKPDGSSLLSNFQFGTSGAGTAILTLPVSGTYKIYIDPQSASTGNVTLTLSEELTGTVSINGSALPLSLSRVGQNAAVTFAGTASQQVTVRITGNTIGSVTVKLFRPDGTQMATATTTAASFNLATQTLPTTGTYKITIDPAGVNVGSLNVSATNP